MDIDLTVAGRFNFYPMIVNEAIVESKLLGKRHPNSNEFEMLETLLKKASMLGFTENEIMILRHQYERSPNRIIL